MGLDIDYQEGQTPLSEEERKDLKIFSITTREELNEFEQNNIESAYLWLRGKNFSLEQILSEQFIKQLHLKMFADVWHWAGKFCLSDKNIGVPWEKISVEIRKMLDDVNYWLENKAFSEDEIAIRLKHRCVSIHPFPNGNGRHSRLLADVLREKIFKHPPFSWGGMALVDDKDNHEDYFSALRQADQGNYESLLHFALS